MPGPWERLERVADQTYLLMLSENTGKPICPERTMRCTLAAALLGDQIICQRITVDQYSGNVVPLAYGPRHGEGDVSPTSPYRLTSLDGDVTQRIRSYPNVSVTDWLDHLGDFAIEEIPQRLESLNILWYGGRPWAKRWRIADSLRAIQPVVALENLLRNPGSYRGDPADVLMLALAEAALLTDKLLVPKHHPNLREHIREFVHALPRNLQPSVQSLIATTQHVIGNAVFTHI